MKKIGLLIIGLIAMVILPFNINAAKKEPITVHMFRGEGCGYCKAALEFFDSIEDEYGEYFNLETHEVWYDEDNAEWMQKVAEHFGQEASGVPYIIIGEKTFQGYAESYDDQIISAIKSYYDKGNFEDIVNKVKDTEGIVTKDDKKENKNTNTNNSKSASKKTTYIIIAVAIVGCIALIYFARDNSEEVEIEEEPKKEEKVVEEPKETKAPAKKTTTAKKATTAKKTTTTKKTTTKKTTAKKAPAKKTTKK